MKVKTVRHMMIAALLLMILADPSRAGELKASYLYNLSDFTGSKPYSSAKIKLDDTKNEIYALSGESVAIFNSSGMEIFRVDYDPTMGVVYDVAIDPGGDLFLLTLKERKAQVVRCNFRAEPISPVELKNLPEELAQFLPDRIFLVDGTLYLASLNSMRFVMVDQYGNYLDTIDLATKIGLLEQERLDSGIGSITLDRQGNFYFTMPTMAKVYRMAKDGQISSFGKRGSGPGKFGVVTGVAADKEGNLLVTDTLRCLVMVFDKDFKLLKEFGFRGFKPGNLIGPSEIAVDTTNKVYVSQIRNRGVSVFQISNG
ncbi:hypothetical protein [Geobacter sp. DSM 9736]|uniref:hypothetical protein n=1 Tax=Geobacter sp. DSM 9736 TaxID=1277350 RepID=UPI000B5011D7|nr:hypothetical protein [Geobacter sp. DSM 9736]SNB47147.1 hypothetical protein SAMN06269301_2623 [Geobacter sp. DSM 9736]